jgi:hypothetical protein
VVAVNVGDAHWVLPPTRALSMPAGIEHRTGASGHARLLVIYADPAPLPEDPRARRVAEALLADPADGRGLAEFGCARLCRGWPPGYRSTASPSVSGTPRPALSWWPSGAPSG